MEVPKCLCMVVCDVNEGEGDFLQGVQEFSHLEQCPLHSAAAAMYAHASALVPYLMPMHMEAEMCTHLAALKNILEEVGNATRRLVKQSNENSSSASQLSEQGLPSSASFHADKEGLDGPGHNGDV